MAGVSIGCSGFTYNHWRGNFYPEGMPQRQWFIHYCSIFSTVELNVTFYRLPKAATFENWRRVTPPGFVFAVKGSRFITHIKRLKEPEEALARYFDAALNLGDKLRVILWQLSPGFTVDTHRLSVFLELLDKYPVRNALEFRHNSWLNDDILTLCRKHNVALCMADWPEFVEDLPLTADFVYLRRHGRSSDHSGYYSTDDLAADSQRIKKYLGEGKDVFIYFNNDASGYAPQNALTLKGML